MGSSSSSSSFNPLHHGNDIQSVYVCKFTSALSSISFHVFTSSIPKQRHVHFKFSSVRADISHNTYVVVPYTENHANVNHSTSRTLPFGSGNEVRGFLVRSSDDSGVKKKTARTHGRDEEKDIPTFRNFQDDFDSKRMTQIVDSVARISSPRSKNGNLVSNSMPSSVVNGNIYSQFKKGEMDWVKGQKSGGGSKEKKSDSLEFQFRVSLDMCSKRGDFLGGIRLYDLAKREGIMLEQYHYTVLLYLCSSAAMGVVQPAKSGRVDESVNILKTFDGESCAHNISSSKNRFPSGKTLANDKPIEKHDLEGNRKHHLIELIRSIKEGEYNTSYNDDNISVGENIQYYALQKGFEIFEKLCSDKIQMNEGTLTSVARLAMSEGNGDKAFDTVRRMKSLGLKPKLRSYVPALTVFCNREVIEKAFSVDKHMSENGVIPKESELQALLKVSIGAGDANKIYYLLHKLRKTFRKVSPPTADLIVKWFSSEEASIVGISEWDSKFIFEAMKNGGGGWHGQGWLKRGRWVVSGTEVEDDGYCNCCREKLALIDLDPLETDNFAESVASLAIQKERNLNFQKFQRWLDYYGPFEAVVDAANVGLFKSHNFSPAKVNAVVNGIRQKLPTKKWPLIVLHNKRISGRRMVDPVNKSFVEKWKNGDAVYATPTGSNDDWYWLYAAIKFKCFLVTNDEMRDHRFQLLGNDFFSKWKERHQVHFSFSDNGPAFNMPSPYSVAIQESVNGHWHIPVEKSDGNITWLCIIKQDYQGASSEIKTQTQMGTSANNVDYPKVSSLDIHKNIRDIFSTLSSSPQTTLSQIEAAENLSGGPLDFQI